MDRVRHHPAACSGSTSTARPRRTLSACYRDGDVHELRDLTRLGGAVRRAGGGPSRGRQPRRARDRHAEEHRLRVRQGGGVGDAGGVRAAARAALPRRRDHAGAGRGDRGRRGRGSATTRSRSPRASSGSRPRSATATRRGSSPGSSDLVVLKTTDSEFHGFPRDRYTTLAETSRPRARDGGVARAGATTAPRRSTTRARALVDDVRRPPLAVAAADAVRDGLGGAGGVPGGRRGPALDAQQAPLRRRPLAVRAGEPERGLPRRRPARTG